MASGISCPRMLRSMMSEVADYEEGGGGEWVLVRLNVYSAVYTV